MIFVPEADTVIEVALFQIRQHYTPTAHPTMSEEEREIDVELDVRIEIQLFLILLFTIFIRMVLTLGLIQVLMVYQKIRGHFTMPWREREETL